MQPTKSKYRTLLYFLIVTGTKRHLFKVTLHNDYPYLELMEHSSMSLIKHTSDISYQLERKTIVLLSQADWFKPFIIDLSTLQRYIRITIGMSES